MTRNLHEHLLWLPEPPADFKERCQSLVANAAQASTGKLLRALAGTRLDAQQLQRLSKAIQRIDPPLASLHSMRLAILGNTTTKLIVDPIIASGLRHGLRLHVAEGNFDQALTDILNPESDVNRFSPDYTLLAFDHRAFGFPDQWGDASAELAHLHNVRSHLQMMITAIRKQTNSAVILQTMWPPSNPLFGHFSSRLPGSRLRFIERYNRMIVEELLDSGDLLLDAAQIAQTVGLADWEDPVQWNVAKLGFSQRFVPLYADHLARILGASVGKARRALVLDLDNTLWGGVIGDDGLAGIKLGQGDAVGEAFISFQRYVSALRSRGVVLCVCSKNFEHVAKEVFLKHPDMVLKEHHIAVFVANWTDKANNIREIAKTLNLGLESLVFVDDNPFEREQVRRELPDVAVPEMPADPAYYERLLVAAGYFEPITFSVEDKTRADLYQNLSAQLILQQSFSDVEGYLQSLQMTLYVSPFDAIGRTRIVQLINKSNQYNLTTRRYSEREIDVLSMDSNTLTLQIRLSDRFNDHGMISVVIVRDLDTSVWNIDSWLMSCRVLGRHVERAVLNEILALAKKRQIKYLCGRFIPTDRNQLVIDHYAKLGFSKISEETGSSVWQLDVAASEPHTVPMKVVHLDAI